MSFLPPDRDDPDFIGPRLPQPDEPPHAAVAEATPEPVVAAPGAGAAPDPRAVMECPFPGPASYDYDRRRSFFGREEETVRLTQRLLDRRVTVLTAGSGDGKTSLLHAGVVPLLYQEGVETAVAEPGGGQPINTIGTICLHRLLPPKAVGLALIARLITAVGGSATLEDARSYCDVLRREERQRLLRGEDAQRPVNLLEGGALVSWLRDGRLSSEGLAAAMGATTLLDGRAWPGVTAPLTEVADFFDGPDMVPEQDLSGPPDEAAARLLGALDAAIKLRQAADPDFEFVLVIDQFEEIFVQYKGGPGATGAPGAPERWKHREALLNFIAQVRDQPWPIRLVLSLRKEHYADLEAFLGEREGLKPLTYHLSPLSGDQAIDCLLKPDEWPDEPPTKAQAQAVVDGLRIEDQFVHPTLLAVVGEWLWFQPHVGALSGEELREASTGAINAFVQRAFETTPDDRTTWDVAERQEALAILSQLILSDGGQQRRNSVAMATLLNAQFARRDLRERLLLDLQKRRLIRIEERASLGGKYVEIVHERLIEAIHAYLGKLRRENEIFAALPLLIDDLRAEARKPVCAPLEPGQRAVLLANFKRLELPSVIAARAVGRLLMDAELGKAFEAGAMDDDETGGGDRETAVGLRDAIEDLAARADEDEAPALDLETRRKEGLLASPAEADRLLAAEPENYDEGRLHFLLASALLHGDRGAGQRIRDLSTRLTLGTPA
jgi:hypothetical protein